MFYASEMYYLHIEFNDMIMHNMILGHTKKSDFVEIPGNIWDYFFSMNDVNTAR